MFVGDSVMEQARPISLMLVQIQGDQNIGQLVQIQGFQNIGQLFISPLTFKHNAHDFHA